MTKDGIAERSENPGVISHCAIPAKCLKCSITATQTSSHGWVVIQYNDTILERPLFGVLLSLVAHLKEENSHVVVGVHTIPLDFSPKPVSGFLINSS